MVTSSQSAEPGTIRSLIPARIDRLPWSRFHTRLVIALGVAWVLDGLEITIAANVGPDLTDKAALGLSASSVADIATWYLIGEVIGALFFGQLSDKLGRRNLFMITLGVYLVGSGLTAITPAGGKWFLFLYGTRVVAGMGIGGEYAAINSAIDEMIPAKYRGRVDLAVNGTYWAGAILGTIATLVLLNNLAPDTSWRLAYAVGPALALVIILVRRHLPESPRWQIMHGRAEAAEASIAEIEGDVAATKGELPPVPDDRAIEVRPTEQIGYVALLRVLFRHYPSRAIYGGVLMITQSFLYNAIFFTYGLVLEFFFHVKTTSTPYYFLAFAAGNLLGPLTIGHLFDTIGRRKMISGTYLVAGILLVITAQLFKAGVAERDHADAVLGSHLLLRLRGRERRLPDRQRDLPAGGAGQGDRGVLRDRAVLRLPRHALVRAPDWHRQGPELAVLGLHPRRRRDDPRRAGRGLPGRGRRGQVAGGHRPTARRHRQTAGSDLPGRRFHYLTIACIRRAGGGPLASGPPSGSLCLRAGVRPASGPASPHADGQHGEIITANSLGNST